MSNEFQNRLLQLCNVIHDTAIYMVNLELEVRALLDEPLKTVQTEEVQREVVFEESKPPFGKSKKKEKARPKKIDINKHILKFITPEKEAQRKALSNWIYNRRAILRMTQKTLSETLKVPYHVVGQLEVGLVSDKRVRLLIPLLESVLGEQVPIAAIPKD